MTQRDTLLSLFKAELLRVAKSVLGKARPAVRPDPPDPATDCDHIWDNLVKLVGNALGITIDAYGTTERARLDGPQIEEARKSLLEGADIHLPHDHDEWLRWWYRRDFHRAEALINRDSLLLTDAMAIHDPKRFFDQATRPLASSNIQALRDNKGQIKRTDEAIEEELHSYLQQVAEPGPPLPNQGRRHQARQRRRRAIPGLEMMRDITMDEMTRMIQTLDNTSAAGYDNIPPALLKAVTMTLWQSEVPKTDADKARDTLDDKFLTYCQMERISEGGLDNGGGTRPPPPSKHHQKHNHYLI